MVKEWSCPAQRKTWWPSGLFFSFGFDKGQFWERRGIVLSERWTPGPNRVKSGPGKWTRSRDETHNWRRLRRPWRGVSVWRDLSWRGLQASPGAGVHARMLEVDGCGVDRRFDSEMLVDDQTPTNTPQQGNLRDGSGQARWAETSHSHWFPCCLPLFPRQLSSLPLLYGSLKYSMIHDESDLFTQML